MHAYPAATSPIPPLRDLRRLLVGLFAVVVLLEVLVALLLEPGRGVSMLYAIASFDGAAVGALGLGGSPWLVMAIAGLWPRTFLRVTVIVFLIALAAAATIKAVYAPAFMKSTTAVIGLALTAPSVLSFAYVGWITAQKHSQQHLAKVFWHLFALFVLMGVFTVDGLNIGLALQPRTFDGMAYRLDAAFGPSLAVRFSQFALDHPLVKTSTQIVYDLIGYVAAVFTGLVLRAGKSESMHLWRYVVWPYAIGGLIYTLLPITGPAYAFPQHFPNAMPEPASFALTSAVGLPAYRNGMPSMHLTGALLLLYAALCIRNRAATWLSVVFVVGTAWATLALGEHYLIDLLAALPFSVTLASILLAPRAISNPSPFRRSTLIVSVLTVMWLLGLRVLAWWFDQNPSVLWLLALASVVATTVAVVNLVAHMRLVNSACPSATVKPTASPLATGAARRWPVVLFFVSGFAGLMYEVVFSKALALSFGSTALANYTVLATYMGGMALGAWIGGRWAAVTSSPLRAYAISELAIGAYAAATPFLFSIMQQLYVSISSGLAPDAAILTPLRIGLGALTLGVPTVLMGVTFPLMLKYVRGDVATSEKSIAMLYASNVVGAACGSLFGGYALLPLAGKNGATLFAAAISLAVALYSLRRIGLTGELQARPSSSRVDEQIFDRTIAAAPTKSTRAEIAVAAAVLLVGGALTLALEVIYIHLLAVVAGNSVYAFALMLTAFLSGLGLGAEICRRWLSGRLSSIRIIACAELGLAAAIAVTSHIWDGIPVYFGSFGAYMPDMGFAGRETVRAVVCFVAMLPSALFIGMAYPAAMEIFSKSIRANENHGIGLAAMLNTSGNILGVFIGGFLLLPMLGSLTSVRVLSYVAFLIAILAVLASQRHSGSLRAWMAGAAAAVLVPVTLQPSTFEYEDLTNGANVYFYPQNWGKHIEHIESVSGGLTSVSTADGKVFTLLTNGKFQGNNAEGGEMIAQVGFAIAPLLHTEARNDALVIGYGTGVTSRVLHEAGFANLDVAEISSDVVALADKYFANVNGKVLTKPGVRLHVTDGRNFLLTQSRSYDLISMEISSIWFAGAANLYNREFYQLAKRRLVPSGVLQQWVQLHHIRAVDVAYVLGSVRSEFKYVWLYVIGGQGIIVATNDPAANRQIKNVDKLLGAAALRPLLELYKNHPEDAAKGLALGPADIERLIQKYDQSMTRMVSTDNNLYLEYSTPKGNALRTGGLAEGNIDTLRQAAGLTDPSQQ